MPDEEANWYGQEASLLNNTNGPSIYALTRTEATKSLANRLLHSRAYILFYVAMAALSITTMVLGLVNGCPGPEFFIIEIIVNCAMIAEVGIRMVALSKNFWKSIFNWVDLAVTALCVATLILLLVFPCTSLAQGEERFEMFVLVARNSVQSGRLLMLMRRSGVSVFSRPKPIDLSRPRSSMAQDIDLSDEEEEADYTRLGTSDREVLFDARSPRSGSGSAPPRPVGPPPPEDDEDMWANIG